MYQQRQLKLGDKMDLWSYLLKPIQRISKYSLLLQDMMRECGPGQTRELAEIKAALEVIHFQLRHGNNLLAMDAIHHCDVIVLCVSFCITTYQSRFIERWCLVYSVYVYRCTVYIDTVYKTSSMYVLWLDWSSFFAALSNSIWTLYCDEESRVGKRLGKIWLKYFNKACHEGLVFLGTFIIGLWWLIWYGIR